MQKLAVRTLITPKETGSIELDLHTLVEEEELNALILCLNRLLLLDTNFNAQESIVLLTSIFLF